MAIIHVTATHGAVPADGRERLGTALARLAYEAEGFAGSALAPSLCWTLFDEKAPGMFSTGVGDPLSPLFYVQVTVLAGCLSTEAKQRLGDRITATLLAGRNHPAAAADADLVWVRFVDVTDGDLVVGGRSTSLAGLRALVAGAA